MKDEQAFPCDRRSNWMAPGMTLRDYFAAKAMPAVYTDCIRRAADEGWVEGWRDGIAQDAYMLADAMLKAREPK